MYVGNNVAEPNLRQSPYVKGALVRLPQGQQRTISNDHEIHPFHSDVCDILAMNVLEAGAARGESLFASGGRIYSDIVGTKPDVVQLLTEPDWVFDKYVVHSVHFPKIVLKIPWQHH